jgi:hypothetical protein
MTLDGTATHVAAFTVDYTLGKPPIGSVVVWDAAGTQVLRVSPPWQLRVNDEADWFVALSAFDPVVALGGRGRCAVWSLTDGRLLKSF